MSESAHARPPLTGELSSTATQSQVHTDPEISALSWPHVEGYEILEEIGRGGMGMVYKAVQKRLNRVVALKMIRPDRLQNPATHDRFHREVLVAAKLTHPNVVMVFDAGPEKGPAYLAMEYIEGVSLHQHVAAAPGGRLSVEQACQFVYQVASGLQHAHERGLVHRDIKPQNLMVVQPSQSDKPLVKILDLGLARVYEEQAEHEPPGSVTAEGGVLGTIDFMAPEQAENPRAADIRADLYSLGCTFFFMLTGRVPFPGGTAYKRLLRHREEPPPPIHMLRDDVPEEVERVVQRLLAKNPDHRFFSPADLATEMERICLADLFRSTLFPKLGRAASAPAKTAPSAPTPPPERTLRPGGVLPAAPDQRVGPLLMQIDDFLRRGREADARFALLRLRGLAPSDPRTKQAEAKVREWSASHTPVGEVRCWREHEDSVWAVAFRPDGQVAASVSRDRTVRLWQVNTGESLGFFDGHRGDVRCAAFSPDAEHVLSGGNDRVLRLWDANNGEETKQLLGHTEPIACVAFAADGRRAVSGSTGRVLRVWDLEAGQQVRAFDGVGGPVLAAAFAGEGWDVWAACADQTLRVWRVENGREVRRLDLAVAPAAPVRAVAFAPDAPRALCGHADGSLALWDVADGRRLARFGGAGAALLSVAYSSDGAWAVTGGEDGLVRLWDVAAGQELYTFAGHHQAVYGVALSPNRRRAASCGVDHTVRLWRLPG